jgi:hypothetical protein
MTPAQETKFLTSLLYRQWWAVWEALKCKPPTMDDIHDPLNKAAIKDYVVKFLPELRRLKGAK